MEFVAAANWPPPAPAAPALLDEWLAEQHMDDPAHVAAKLRAEGFDTVAKLRELTSDALKELDLSLYSRTLLLNRLALLQQGIPPIAADTSRTGSDAELAEFLREANLAKYIGAFVSNEMDLPTLMQFDEADLKRFMPTKGPQVRLKKAIEKRKLAGGALQHQTLAAVTDTDKPPPPAAAAAVAAAAASQQELAQARLREAALLRQVGQLPAFAAARENAEKELAQARLREEALLKQVDQLQGQVEELRYKLLTLIPGPPVTQQQPQRAHGDMLPQSHPARQEPEPQQEEEIVSDARSEQEEEAARIAGLGIDLRVIHATPVPDPASAGQAAEAWQGGGGGVGAGGDDGGSAARGRWSRPYVANDPLIKCKYGGRCRDPNCPYTHPRPRKERGPPASATGAAAAAAHLGSTSTPSLGDLIAFVKRERAEWISWIDPEKEGQCSYDPNLHEH